jgi:hypothetical protein
MNENSNSATISVWTGMVPVEDTALAVTDTGGTVSRSSTATASSPPRAAGSRSSPALVENRVQPWATQRVDRPHDLNLRLKLVSSRAAADRLAEDPGADLARLATELGWSDQAHFTHDFKDVIGFPPSEYAVQCATAGRELVLARR